MPGELVVVRSKWASWLVKKWCRNVRGIMLSLSLMHASLYRSIVPEWPLLMAEHYRSAGEWLSLVEICCCIQQKLLCYCMCVGSEQSEHIRCRCGVEWSCMFCVNGFGQRSCQRHYDAGEYCCYGCAGGGSKWSVFSQFLLWLICCCSCWHTHLMCSVLVY